MEHFKTTTHRPEETYNLGMSIGKLAIHDDVFLLVGNLGTGKTCLTQGIGRGLGIKEYIPSPSFVLIRQFYGRLILYHIDLYRLDLPQEIAFLGLEDYLYGGGVCVIEWAEKGLTLMPPEYLLIKIDYLGDTKRNLEFEARGNRYEEILDILKVNKD